MTEYNVNVRNVLSLDKLLTFFNIMSVINRLLLKKNMIKFYG